MIGLNWMTSEIVFIEDSEFKVGDLVKIHCPFDYEEGFGLIIKICDSSNPAEMLFPYVVHFAKSNKTCNYRVGTLVKIE